ncbi:MerR family transcriptional regulator [Gracilibacillus sp. Marseille-QA3620]
MKDNQILRAFSIKEVSRKINVPAGTIRQWEKDLTGVLVIPRSKQGSRFYTEVEIAILKRIKEMRDKNLSKDIIKEMLQKHLKDGQNLSNHASSNPPSEASAPAASTSVAVVEKPAEPKLEEFLHAMDAYKTQFMKEMSNEMRNNRNMMIEEVKKEISQGSIDTIKGLSKSIQRSSLKTNSELKKLSQNVSNSSERTSETVETLTRSIARSSEGAFESFSKRISEAAADGYRELLSDLSSSVSEAQNEIKSVTEAIYQDREQYFETMNKELEQYRHDIKQREEAFQQMVTSFRDAAPTKEKEKTKPIKLKEHKKEKAKDKLKTVQSKASKKAPVQEAAPAEKKWWSFRRKSK